MTEYIKRTRMSKKLFDRANKVLPGGVSYAIRALPPYPFYINHAKGVKLFDVDGNIYTDYWVGHGALILGHAHDLLIEAVTKQLPNGTHFGFSHEHEIDLAEKVIRHIPSAEMIRFTNSGTEANMYGTRIARAYTGRNKMLKIEGGWHGGYDSLHVSVTRPYGRSESAGLNQKVTQDTFAVPFNNLEAAIEITKKNDLACIILEPVMGAAGFITPEPGYLKGLRELCDDTETLLIFDEVITGFRLGIGGAQERCNVIPDLTIIGKILGGGFPIGAFCGKTDIMELIDHNKFPEPERRSAHGGTFTGNPVSMVAGSTTIKALENGVVYKHINRLGEDMRSGLLDIFNRSKIPASVTGIDSMLGIHFQDNPPKNAGDTAKSDLKLTRAYFNHMLESNIIYMSPNLSHSLISSPHTKADVDAYLSATEDFFKIQK
jgi:glutamate-1-semialdehyde 2,1-aminomutase